MIGYLAHLVSLAFATQDVLFRDLEVVKVDSTCGRGTDSELFFLLRNPDSHVLGRDKASDALVALARVNLLERSMLKARPKQRGTCISEDEEDLCLVRVGNPHLGAIEDPMRALFLGPCLKSERVRAGRGFRQAERTELGFRKQREPFILLLLVSVFSDDSVYKSVVHVAEDGDGGVNLGQFFNGNDSRGEGAISTSMFRAGLNAHKLRRHVKRGRRAMVKRHVHPARRAP